MLKTYTSEYILGITEGRVSFNRIGIESGAEELACLQRTIKGFPASTAVGQMLRGERDFWLNQLKRKTA